MILAFVVALVGWAVVVVALGNLVSQWRGWSRPVVVILAQALTRPLLPALALVTIAAAFTGQLVLALAGLAATAATFGFAVALARPVARRTSTVAAAATVTATTDSTGATTGTLTIAHGNVWFENTVAATDPQRVVDALRHADPDVIAISEYSHEIAAALATTTLPGDYPHQVLDPDVRGLGSAIFSRRPLIALTPPSTAPRTTAALIDGITVMAVHTPSPVENLDEWNVALGEWKARVPSAEQPTVAIGDYNADLFHPALRATLAGGWRDAHRELGAIASTSWPTHLRLVPPLVRLDRALVNESVELLDISGAALPGSDHRVVTVTVGVAATSEASEN